MTPTISVIISIRNAEDYVRQCIDSILQQSFKDFELLLFDDRSTDSTLEILQSYDDPRIQLEANKTVENFVELLNKGLDKAKGKYIANMDGDDYCDLTRFQKQVDFMESHPSVGVLGSRAEYVGAKTGLITPALDDIRIKAEMLLASQIIHGATMIRREVLETHKIRYNPEFKASQDYSLWVDLIEHTEFRNLEDPLLKYRIHDSNASFTSMSEKVIDNTKKIKAKLYKKVFPGLAEADIVPLTKLFLREFEALSWDDILRIYPQIKSQNVAALNEKRVYQLLDKSTYKYALSQTPKGLSTYKQFKKLPLSKKFSSTSKKLELFTKCLFSMKAS